MRLTVIGNGSPEHAINPTVIPAPLPSFPRRRESRVSHW